MGRERQDEPHDHRVRSNSVDAHYDFLRDNGYSRDKARDWAERATDKFYAAQEGTSASPAFVASSPAPTRPRKLLTPHVGPLAGRLCRRLPDGTLEPID